MKTKTIKVFSLLAAILIAVCTSTLFASCGSDDDDNKVSNSITVNGKTTSAISAVFNEGGGSVVIALAYGSISAGGVGMTSVGITLPTNQYGKTLDLSKEKSVDWSIMGIVNASNRSLLEPGSTLLVNKSGDVYTVSFTLIKKEANGSLTTIKGGYEGKGLSVNVN